jgi:hypothetical protein
LKTREVFKIFRWRRGCRREWNEIRKVEWSKELSDIESTVAPPALRSRGWGLRFSLRGLLIVVTLLCVALAWRLHRARLQKEAVQAIRDGHGWVYYDYQQYDPKNCEFDKEATPWEPVWLQAQVGIDFFHDVEAVNMSFHGNGIVRRDEKLPDVNIARHLAHLPKLRFLGLTEQATDDEGMRYIGQLRYLEVLLYWDAPQITNAGAVHLTNMPSLRCLHIGSSQIGDRGLATIARLPRLETLSMQCNNFTDAGLAALSGNPRLKDVWVGGLRHRPSRITDAGVLHLAKLPALEELDLQHTHVTLEGLAPLQGLPLKDLYLNGSPADDQKAAQALFPHCKISAKSN